MSLLNKRRAMVEAERLKKAKAAGIPATQRTQADVNEAEELLKKVSEEFGDRNEKLNEQIDKNKGGTYIPSLKPAGEQGGNPMDRIVEGDEAKKLVEEAKEDKETAKPEEVKEEVKIEVPVAATEEEVQEAVDAALDKLPGQFEPAFSEPREEVKDAVSAQDVLAGTAPEVEVGEQKAELEAAKNLNLKNPKRKRNK